MTTTHDKIMTIELPSCVDADYSENLLVSIKEWLTTPIELFTFDFKNTVEFKQSCYRPLLTISQYIRKSGKNIASYNLKQSVDRQIKFDGIADALNIVEDYNAFVAKLFKTKTGQVDVQIINPFLEATLVTLEKQANTKSEAQKPLLVSVDDKGTTDDIAIAGIISLHTQQFNGSITLAFPEIVFLKIYESMFGEKVDKITSEIEDAAGELLNIIYGSAKTQLNAKFGYKLAPALPTILSGEKIKIRQKTFKKIIILPFKTQFGFFRIEISFDPQN